MTAGRADRGAPPVPWPVLVAASARTVAPPLVALPVAAAAVVVAVAAPVLDDPVAAVGVARLVALLLAVAVAVAVDEPRDLAAASPTPEPRRLVGRLAVVGAVVVPAWAVALAVVAVRGGGGLLALTVEGAALAAVAVAAAAGLRCWRGVAEPAVLVAPVVLGLLLAAVRLPRGWSLLAAEPAAPDWAAAHTRWALVCLGGLAVTALAYRRRG